MSDSPTEAGPSSLSRVLAEEYTALHGGSLTLPEHLPEQERLRLIYESIHHLAPKRSAVCFSGGGIRSATIGLGVLQILARVGLFQKFDFLSTVSGGGYIGSWLSAWIHNHPQGFAGVADELRKEPQPPDRVEPQPLTHLRMFSNYLSPRLGLLSADSWTLVGTYLRNLILNWLVLVPFLLALLATPLLYRTLIATDAPRELMGMVAATGSLLLLISLTYLHLCRPSLGKLRPREKWSWFETQRVFLFACLIPLLAGVSLLTVTWEWYRRDGHALDDLALFGLSSLFTLVLGAAVMHTAAWLVAMFVLRRPWRDRWRYLELLTIILSGLAGGGLLWVVLQKSAAWYATSGYEAWYTCGAVPLFLSLFLLAATLFIGIASRSTGDSDREWWGRAGSWLLIAAASWAGATGIAIGGPWVSSHIPGWIASAGGVTGLFTLIFGFSSKTAANPTAEETGWWAHFGMKFYLLLLAPLTVALILALLAHVNAAILRRAPWFEVSEFIIGMALFSVLMSFFININKFSLHAMYRNRLIRAYLGASRLEKRSPNPFTGFDSADNFSIADLAPSDRPVQRPLHVINIALNLVHGQNLAWQERKAQSFTVSPLHCGSGTNNLGYRRSSEYGRNPAVNQALTIGTALAISGAAASPNMGYHSSPAITFLLTLFNIRLGWWLGNPGKAGDRTYSRSCPEFAIGPLLAEAFGYTDEQSRYVYLSDGGHFENLGLYEMVLRRCHFILVVDAGCDSAWTFQDLGNAIRKIRIDQGIDIDISLDMLERPDGSRYSRRHHAIGTIRYDKVDPGAPVGTLLYVKASLTGDEPPDVEEYAKQHEAFPHESTADQFFDESQFESYRRLGQHMGREVLRVLERTPYRDVSHVCSLLRSYWISPPPGIQDSFLRETRGLIELERTLRDDPSLARYDLELYPELRTLFGADPALLPTLDPRMVLHLCNEQIRLMENVFMAVRLDEFHAHPLNRGWMNLFRRWASSARFRSMWPMVRGTFSRPFVDFAETHLSLDVAISVVRCIPPDALRAVLLHEYRLEWPHRLDQLSSAINRPLPMSDDPARPTIWLAADDATLPLKDFWGVAVAYQEGLDALQLSVWVRLAYRNLGIGTRLLSQALAELTKQYAGRMLLVDLGPDNPGMKGFQQQKAAWLWFYEQTGFTRDRSDETRLRMRKVL